MSETPKEAARRLAASAIADGFEPQALHGYTDIEGRALYWRVRLTRPKTGEKWIRPMKLNGAGYVLGEPDFPDGKPLYRLHTIGEEPDVPVIVTEGEFKADKLAALGLTVTTSGSADSAEAADWRPLAGRDVLVWPDNDEAGGRYAQAVSAILSKLGCKVSVVDVSALGLPPKGDAADWLVLRPGATRDDVLALPSRPAATAALSEHCAVESVGGARTNANAPHGEPRATRSVNAPVARVDGWPEPQPLTAKFRREPYPLDSLPNGIRAAVEEVTGFVKAPAALVASSALAALSLASQAQVDVKRLDRLHGPVGLFVLVIAESGERKSTCDGFFTKPISDYEEAKADEAKRALKDQRPAIEAWEAKCAGVKEKIRQLAKAQESTADMESALRDLERDRPVPPRVPRLLYADATPEALAYGLAKHWPSGGVVSAEAGIVFGSHGMGKDSVMRNLGQMNQLWDGKSLHIDRRSTESFTVRDARLTVALQVQEATLREFLDRSGALARGTGFLARFLLAWPESTQGARHIDPDAPDGPATWPHLAAFHRRIDALLVEHVPIDEDGTLTPRMLTLTPEARRAWVDYHNAIESELSSGGELYDVRDVASKSADNAARLAALFHMFEGGDGAIGLETFESASRIAAWHLHESRRFFGELALPAELVDAARLDAWLIEYCRRERTHMVGKNHVRQRGPLRNGAQLNAAIRELEALDRVRLEKNGKRLTIHLHPALVGMAP